MQPFTRHTGIAALMNRRNVDTDQIIPKQFLKKVERTGFGVHLFQDWRYHADGSENSRFELNNPAFKGASILVAGDNFGCGSSREHAPWAIRDYGFTVVISTSFADIFFSNCFKNGILPIRVSETELHNLMEEIAANEGVEFSVDLESQTVTTPGGRSIRFEVDAFRKESLLQGLDDIAWTLKHQDEILAFERRQKQEQPWLWL
ncbi:3-isopropylmalate dehydratase small subunit [hydrothermal vent metagenome]|uniref:3-isopropylmalate dehydratase n=1 Tax=hydrothermal vent metagenome TaxID=652676 RepID=A0A3B1BAI2_9ZZZZ